MSDTVVTAKFVADTSSLQKGAKQAANSLQDVQKGAKQVAGQFTLMKGVVGAAFGTAAVMAVTNVARAMKQFATDAVAAAQESLVTERRLENIARSMGVLDGALGGTTERLTSYADSLRAQTGVNDETIKSAQAMILTFEAVAKTAGESGGMFDRATAAALDLAAAGFGSIESNAVRLARALQDPIKGMTALTRSGVTFTQQERETIKTLVESGRQFEAQNVIMQAVEKQVGGTAAATATNAAKMASAFEEVQESIGFALLPAVESVAGAILTHAVPALNDFAEEAKTTMGPQLAESFQEMLPTILSLGESFLSIANSIRSAMAPAMQVVIRLFQSVVPLVDLLAKALAAVPGPIAVIAGALLLLRTRMGQALVAGVATAQGAVATGFASMRASVITFTNTLKVEMIKARTQMGALVAAARTTALGVAGAFRTMAGAVKGFMVSLGPVGWALIAVTVAFEAFSSRSAEAEQRAMAYKDALDQVTGAATRASTEMTIFNLMQKEVGGLYGIGARSFEDLATKANLSMADISAALHGTTAEYDAFIIRMQEAAEQGSINWAEYSLLNEALHEERSALEGARVELENKNRAEAEAAAATAAATSATVAAAIAAGNAAGPTNGLATAIGGVGSEADEAADEIAAMRTEYEGWLTVTSQISAVDKAAESIENLGTASVEFGTNLMGQTPKARDFRAEVITAFEDSAKAAQSLSDDLPTQRAIFTGELVKIVNSLKASGVKPRDIEAFLGAMDDLPASVSDIMRAAAKAVGDTDFKSQVEKAFDKSVKAGAPMTADAMERLAQGASDAAKSQLGLTLEPELASVIRSGTTALRPTAFSNGELTGKSIGSGMALGINQSSPIVQAAVARVVAQAKAAADAAAKAQSPSRLFAETGDDMAAGVAMGWLRMSPTIMRAITSIIPRAKGESSKLARGLAQAFVAALEESSGSVASAISSIFGSIPTKTPLEVQLGVKGAEKFIKNNKQALAALLEVGEAIDRINEKVKSAGEAFASLGDLVARPFGRASQITEMFGSEADIDSVINGFMDIRDQVTQAYAVLTDASIVGERAAARNQAQMERTIATLQNLAAQAVKLRENHAAVMNQLETLETNYQAEVKKINSTYDGLEKDAEAKIKAIEDRWAAAIPVLEKALQGATAAFEKENAALQSLINERDQFMSGIKSGFRSFVNSLSFQSSAATKQIVRETKRLASGVTVTLEKEIEVGGGPASIRQTLEDRLEAVRAFSRNIRTLMERGLDPALVKDFVTAGVAGAGDAAAALAAGSADDISAINEIQAGLLSEAESFGKYASAQWHDAAIAQQQAIITPLEIARDQAQIALDAANALRDKELSAARAHLAKLQEQRQAALAQAEKVYLAEKARLEGEAAALQAQMDEVAAQIEAVILAMLNTTATKSAEAGVLAGQKLLEGFRKEYPGVYRKLNTLMDQLAASLTRTATVTVRTVYEAVMPVTPPPTTKIPKREMGGPVSARTAYLVGERGPELFVPGYAGNIIPNNRLGNVPSMAARGVGTGGSTNITINVSAGMGTDGAEVGRQIVESIRKYERRSGPVFVSA